MEVGQKKSMVLKVYLKERLMAYTIVQQKEFSLQEL